MSSRSLRNAVSRPAHKERSQPEARKKFGFLEKHKDYVERAKSYHKKEETIRKLKEKASFRNPDEFYFKMYKTRTVDGVHKIESDAIIYTEEELALMKTQDIGYVFQKIQSEKKKIERLSSMLHSLDNRLPNKHTYYAEDREEAREIQIQSLQERGVSTTDDIPDNIKRKTAASYRELEARKNRVNELEKVHRKMELQKELHKKGKKRILREDEIVCPTAGPVYKWRTERKR